MIPISDTKAQPILSIIPSLHENIERDSICEKIHFLMFAKDFFLFHVHFFPPSRMWKKTISQHKWYIGIETTTTKNGRPQSHVNLNCACLSPCFTHTMFVLTALCSAVPCRHRPVLFAIAQHRMRSAFIAWFSIWRWRIMRSFIGLFVESQIQMSTMENC